MTCVLYSLYMSLCIDCACSDFNVYIHNADSIAVLYYNIILLYLHTYIHIYIYIYIYIYIQ